MKPGNFVKRVLDVGRNDVLGDMTGIVLRVIPRNIAGGVRALVKVKWSNGHEATLQDRQLQVVEPEMSAYERHIAAMVGYARRRILRGAHGPWDLLRADIERDYSRGLLSDNEHDDLLNRWLEEAVR